jgi:hypothetical protein
MPDTLIIGAVFLVVGLIIGWALGTLRTNASLILYFRDYYRRQADERMRGHTNYLIGLTKSYGAAADSHRRAATEAFDGGRRGFRSISPFDPISHGNDERKESKPISHILEFRK